MAIEGQVQTNGERKRVYLNGKWEEVDKIQTNPSTGQRRAIIQGKPVDLPAKANLPTPPVEAPTRKASAYQPPRTGLLNSQQQEQIKRREYDEMYSIGNSPINQNDSNALGEYVPTEIVPSAAQAFAREEDYARMLQQRNPGSELFRDSQGNLIIQFEDGEQKRINAEGLSMGDVMGVAGDMGGMLAAGRLLKSTPVIGSALNTFSKKAIGQGVGAATYVGTSDVVGNLATGAEGIDVLPDISRTGMELIGGTAAQKILGDWAMPWVQRQWRNRVGNSAIKREITGTPPGQLADTARVAMEKADIPTKGLTEVEIQRVNTAVLNNPNLKGAELGRAIATEGVAGYKPTSGAVSQDPQVLFDENRLRTTGGSMQSRAEMTGASLERPNEYIDRTMDPLNEPMPLASAQDDLVLQRQTEMEGFTGVKDAEGIPQGGRFKEARAEAGGYEMEEEQLLGMRDRMYNRLRAAEDAEVAGNMAGTLPDIDPPQMPEIPESLTRPGKEAKLEAWIDKAKAKFDDATVEYDAESIRRRGGMAPSQTTGLDQNLTPADWLNWAERISSDGSPGGAIAARTVRDELSKMAEEEALGGVEGGVFDYLKTHGEYGEMLTKWRTNPLIDAMTRKSKDGITLAKGPAEVADTVLGGRASGFLTKTGARDAVERMKLMLPDNEWIKVRKELEFRLLGGGKGKNAATNTRSPTAMYKSFNEAIERHGEEFVEGILDDGTGNGAEMLASYKRFLKISANNAPQPGKNSRIASDTAGALESFGQGKAGEKIPGLGMMLKALRGGAKGLSGVAKESADTRMTRGLLDPNNFLAPEISPKRIGILSQLYQPPEDYVN